VLNIDATVQSGVDYTVMAVDRLSQIKGRFSSTTTALPPLARPTLT
jgi:hypothetical protein